MKRLTIVRAGSPNTLSPSRKDTATGVFLWDSLQKLNNLKKSQFKFYKFKLTCKLYVIKVKYIPV